MSGAWLPALLGKVLYNSEELELAGGLNFTGQVTATRNDLTNVIDVQVGSASFDPTQGDLDGTIESPVVVGIQGVGVLATSPAAGDTLIYNGSLWEPGHSFQSIQTTGFVGLQASANATGYALTLRKTRGSGDGADVSNVVANDSLGELVFAGKTETAGVYASGASIKAVAQSAFASGVVFTKLVTSLGTGAGLVEVAETSALTQTIADASTYTWFTIPIASDETVDFVVDWFAHQVGSNNKAKRTSSFTFRRQGAAAPTQWGGTTDLFPTTKDDATWGALDFAVSGNNILLRAAGKAATNIRITVEYGISRRS